MRNGIAKRGVRHAGLSRHHIIIYAAEGHPLAGVPLQRLLARVDAAELSAATSELTVAKVLVKPLKDGDARLADSYRGRLTTGPTLSVLPVSREVLERAAELRAAYGSLKLPDAIHAATALVTGCTTFLTNDARFEAVVGLPVLLMSKLP